MSTKIYLTNIPSGLSGVSPSPLLATIGTRGSTASASSISIASTATTAGTTTNNMTLLGGGTTALWITRPLSAAVTVAGTLGINFWSQESAATALAGVDFQIFRYNSTLSVIGSTAVATSSINVHAVSGTATRTFVTLLPTSTAFSVGDRIAILGNVNPSQGVEAASQSVQMDFNGLTQGADGDTWIEFNEDIATSTAQAPQRAGGPSNAELEDMRVGVSAQAGFAGAYYSPDARLEDVVNELAAQRDLTGA